MHWLTCPTCHSFQSTLPVKGATNEGIWKYSIGDFSIHAPREGSDTAVLEAIKAIPQIFNPRSP